MKINRDSVVFLIVVVVLGGVAALGVYVPQGKRLERIKAEAASQQMVLQSQSAQAAAVPAIMRQIHDMKLHYKDFDRRLPKRKELGGFLREISSNMAEEQLSNQLIEPGKPSREELFHMLPITMKFQGRYLSMASLLKRIGEMERLTRVQKLSISADSKKDGDLSIEVLLNIYFTES